VDNRRQHERAPAILRIAYPSAGVLRTDYAENISRGGLFIATDAPFAVGQRVELRLACPGGEAIPVTGTVRWAGEHRGEDGGAATRGVGVAFDLDGPARVDLEARIDALLAAVSASELPADGLALLLVDPNRHARTLVREGLQALALETWSREDGLRVAEAEDGAEALERLAEGPFGLVIVELRTPGVDGIDLIRRIRTGVSPSLPVFATARPFPGAREEALAAGADVFLPKPLRLKPLFNTLRMILRRA
jgi:uncharacterized protein (TIGR02266 family)